MEANVSWREVSKSTNEKRDTISRSPSPISACAERMLRVVVFDSTQMQASSKYFLYEANK